jgi:hypothetical protein
MITGIIAGLTSFATILGVMVSIQSQLKTLRSKTRDQVTLIGVPTGVTIPDYLRGVADFTNYNKAIKSGHKIVLLHTKNITKALRLCDFVLVTAITDPKLLVIDTDYGRNRAVALVDGV